MEFFWELDYLFQVYDKLKKDNFIEQGMDRNLNSVSVYSRVVNELISEIHRLEKEYVKYKLWEYPQILEKRGISSFSLNHVEQVDVLSMDFQGIAALLVGMVHEEHYRRGTILQMLDSGLVFKWLERLKVIERSKQKIFYEGGCALCGEKELEWCFPIDCYCPNCGVSVCTLYDDYMLKTESFMFIIGSHTNQEMLAVERKSDKIILSYTPNIAKSLRGRKQYELTESEYYNYLSGIYQCSLLDWKTIYGDENKQDGLQWKINIKYQDQSEKTWCGYNEYPLRWDVFVKATKNFSINGKMELNEKRAHETEYFRFSSGGFFSGHNVIEIVRRPDKIIAKVDKPFSFLEECPEIELSEEVFFDYIRGLYDCDLWGWKEEYVEDVLDGHQWEIKIKLLNQQEKRWYGSNAYPVAWENFQKAVNILDLPDV